MASIVQRGNSYNVVYLYDAEDGKRKQKWESFKTLADAKRRKSEVEYRQQMGSMVIPNCKTVEDLMREYVAIYGKSTWSLSMYSSTNALMEHYILPLIGSMKLSDITARVLEKYYMQLLQTPAVRKVTDRKYTKKENGVCHCRYGQKGSQRTAQCFSSSSQVGADGKESGHLRNGSQAGGSQKRNLGCGNIVPCAGSMRG